MRRMSWKCRQKVRGENKQWRAYRHTGNRVSILYTGMFSSFGLLTEVYAVVSLSLLQLSFSLILSEDKHTTKENKAFITTFLQSLRLKILRKRRHERKKKSEYILYMVLGTNNGTYTYKCTPLESHTCPIYICTFSATPTRDRAQDSVCGGLKHDTLFSLARKAFSWSFPSLQRTCHFSGLPRDLKVNKKLSRVFFPCSFRLIYSHCACLESFSEFAAL